MPIRALAPDVIDQIAAGEVVERPASVVKELVENALDAQARNITVRLREGGIALCEVIDDGDGMAAHELPLALMRHATSKLQTVDDLSTIASYGFRGEALPSIAAVSRLRLQSRPRGSDRGYALDGSGGEPQPCAMPPGTCVTVEALFTTVPARRKFLLGPQAEARRVSVVLERLALAAPGVAFRLEVDGREVLRTSGGGNLVETVQDLFGYEVADAMLPVSYAGEAARLQGLVSRPGKDRGNRSLQFLTVGSRPVATGSLRYAVESAYRGALLKGRFPIFVLRLDVMDGDVDVNVHPAKLEVRFRREREVAGIVHQGVLGAVGNDAANATWTARQEAAPAAPPDAPLFLAESEPQGLVRPSPASKDLPPQPARGSPPQPIGQALGFVVVAADAESLYLFDQHAVHERINYERLEDREERSAQLLLSPVVLRLTPSQSAALSQHEAELAAFGFEVEPFGDRDAIVRAVPRIFGREAGAPMLSELLDALGGTGEDPLERAERLRREIAACRASVKANDHLTLTEQSSLIRRLWSCEQPGFCPHGRPTYIRLGATELRARLGRR